LKTTNPKSNNLNVLLIWFRSSKYDPSPYHTGHGKINKKPNKVIGLGTQKLPVLKFDFRVEGSHLGDTSTEEENDRV